MSQDQGIQEQQTEVMQTPQGEVAETTTETEETVDPLTMDLGQPIQAEETEVVSEENTS